jgi:lantibiotic modifying enzyme
LEAARGAFAFEDALSDPGAGNWPDLRGRDGGGPPRFAVAWCHGAPGIALSRLLAARLDPSRADAYLTSARRAIATTLGAIEATSHRLSLCHGLAGLIEVVGLAGEMLDDADGRGRARDAGRALAARLGDLTACLPNPSLMLGTAGVAHALLRRHDPTGVAPVLIVTPSHREVRPRV